MSGLVGVPTTLPRLLRPCLFSWTALLCCRSRLVRGDESQRAALPLPPRPSTKMAMAGGVRAGSPLFPGRCGAHCGRAARRRRHRRHSRHAAAARACATEAMS